MQADLDDVRIFTRVVEVGSFTRAAAELNLPKSTVSRRISQLEDKLGVRLLQRTTRKLHLTAAGELYFRHTSRSIEELEDAERLLEQLQDAPSGLLRVTAPSDLGGAIPEMFAAFMSKYPLMKVHLLATGRRVDLIGEDYDVAIRAGALADSSMVSRKLLGSRSGFFASPQYLARCGTPQTHEDLLQHNCLRMKLEGGSHPWTLEGPEGEFDVKASGSFSSNDLNVLIQATLQGLGIGLFPILETHKYVDSGELIRLLPQFQSIEYGIYALYPSARHLSPRVRLFVDFIGEWMKTRYHVCTKATSS